MTVKRVLIVDDSATIRQIIRNVIAHDRRLEVVGEASDPYDAREKIRALNPDVLTLDVEMPRMNGIEFLEKIMRLRPLPVIMISSMTQRGSAAALEALSIGAVDCIGKPRSGDLREAFAELPGLLYEAANARLRQVRRAPVTQCAYGYRWNGKYVFIGSSTGGVDALETVLAHYPPNCPPTLITQHMPESFLRSFAKRLNGQIAPTIAVATEGAPLREGHVYIAPGGDYHLEVRAAKTPTCHLLAADKVSGHRPSVDVLFRSAVPLAAQSLGFILTGMGRDGADGMRALRQAGARCFAQNEQSSVVFGMPRVALEIGGAESAVALEEIGPKILRMTDVNAGDKNE